MISSNPLNNLSQTKQFPNSGGGILPFTSMGSNKLAETIQELRKNSTTSVPNL